MPATTDSASATRPSASSTPDARPSRATMPVTSAPKANSTLRSRQRSYTASASARIPPRGYQLPKVCSMYGSTAALAGAVRGSRP